MNDQAIEWDSPVLSQEQSAMARAEFLSALSRLIASQAPNLLLLLLED